MLTGSRTLEFVGETYVKTHMPFDVTMTINPPHFLYSEIVQHYDFGEGHPFRGDRYSQFMTLLKKQWPIELPFQMIEVPAVTDRALQLICDSEYIAFTRQYYHAAYRGTLTSEFEKRFLQFQSSDNHPRQHPGNLEYAARVIVGQSKQGIDLLQRENIQRIISIGGGMHHAQPDYGEGFCLYNDVAFAALHLLHSYDLTRIAIIDTDAHAGNGTMAYFEKDPRVLLIDFHQDPETIYPGTGFIDQIGTGEGEGYTINVPLPIFARFSTYQRVFETIVEPILREFRPQLIIRNGGSDPHFMDHLTSLGLTVADFYRIGSQIRSLANVHCDGKILDLLASGYNQNVLSFCWVAHIAGLMGIDLPIYEPYPVPSHLQQDPLLDETNLLISNLSKILSEYWRFI